MRKVTYFSTMSTGLNSMSGVIYEDMIKPCVSRPISQNTAGKIMKFTVVVIGIICVALVSLVEKLSGIIQVTTQEHIAVNLKITLKPFF